MKRLCVIFFTVIAFSASAQVIIEALPRWHSSAHLNFLYPGEPIDQFLHDNQTGFQFEFQYRVKYNKPFMAGVYYNESGLSKYILYYTQSSGTGDIEIKEKANTRRIETGITAGFYPEINWLLQPYLQGRVGLAIFQTSSILTDNEENEEPDRISENTSIAPAYGIDLGIHIIPNIWYLRGDVRIGWTANTSLSYLLLNEENAGTTGFPIDYFDSHTSSGRWFKIDRKSVV